MNMQYNDLFLLGANELAAMSKQYGPDQVAAGFTQEEWELLTQDECWNIAEQRRIAGVLASAVSITLNVAGLPAAPLPGAYVAAVICKLCSPCNRLVASLSAPASFDARSALGLDAESIEVITTPIQMQALVIHFSSASFAALSSFPIDEVIAAAVLAAE